MPSLNNLIKFYDTSSNSLITQYGNNFTEGSTYPVTIDSNLLKNKTVKIVEEVVYTKVK